MPNIPKIATFMHPKFGEILLYGGAVVAIKKAPRMKNISFKDLRWKVKFSDMTYCLIYHCLYMVFL